jgi:phage protein U
MTEGARSIPLLGDFSLEYVQRVEHSLDSGFISTRIANLPGELQQRTGRPSHRIRLQGMLFGESAADQLSELQNKAAAGEELTFAADITTALELQKVVITSFHALEQAGKPGRYHFDLALAESPPLPPPAQVESFGGLGDFGLGDLGFDTDILGDIEDLAGEVAGAVNQALEVIDQLGALANLAELGELGDFMQPIDEAVNAVKDLTARFGDATRSLGELFGS